MSPTALKDQTEIEDLPLYLPEQNAVLVGKVLDGESDMANKVAYYVHWRDGVYLGSFDAEDRAFAPRYALEADSRIMSHQVEEFTQLDAQIELSTVGRALADAYDYAETELLPDKQAHVYALREHGFDRREIADILNVSPSTVDSQRYGATEKVEAAEAFVSLQREKSGTRERKEIEGGNTR